MGNALAKSKHEFSLPSEVGKLLGLMALVNGATRPNLLYLENGQLMDVHGLRVYLLASQSDAHTIAPHRDPIPYPSTYSSKARKTHDVIYFGKGNRTRTSKTMFPSEKQEPRTPRKPRKPR